jgi:hypothetical protein
LLKEKLREDTIPLDTSSVETSATRLKISQNEAEAGIARWSFIICSRN